MVGLGFAIGLLPRRRGSAFDPLTLFAAGEQGAWYDPSDLASMFQDNVGTVPAAVDEPVGRILDKSGRGNHAGQSTSAARPMLRRDGAGRLHLELDGVDDCLKATFAIAQPWQRVSAIRQLSWTVNEAVLGGAAANAGNLYTAGASPQLAVHSGLFGPITGAASIGTNAVLTERHSGATSQLAVNAGGHAVASAGTTAPGGITLGAFHNGSGAAHARIYGVIMVGRQLTEAEIAGARRFLAARAGVAL